MILQLVIVLAALAAVDSTAVLRLLPDALVKTTGARCLDGSAAGYYYHFNEKSTRFVFFLEGGGYCLTEEACKSRTSTDFGSSKAWPASIPDRADSDIISVDPTLNPDFYDDNHIWVPYCSGDVYSGTRKVATEDTWGLYFAGHQIIEAIIADLRVQNHLDEATEIIVGGISAGGIGTLNNVDYIAEAFPHATVTGYLNGGWFIPVEDYGQFDGTSDESVMGKTIATAQALYDPFVDETCRAIYGPMPVFCILGPIVQPFLRSRIFVAEMIFDAEQIFIEHGTPAVENSTVAAYIGFFGEAMSTSTLYALPVNSGVTQSTGLYLASCLGHYVDWNLIEVESQSLQTTFHNWYFKTAGNAHVFDKQSQLPINPSCVGVYYGSTFGADSILARH